MPSHRREVYRNFFYLEHQAFAIWDVFTTGGTFLGRRASKKAAKKLVDRWIEDKKNKHG